MGLRHKSIRLRVLLLVLIPVLSLIGVYAYAATLTVSAAVSLSRATAVRDATAAPTGQLQQQLDAERRLALMYLATRTSRGLTRLDRQQGQTGQALAAFQQTARSRPVRADGSASEKAATAQLIQAAAALPRLRGRVAAGRISRASALSQYSAVVTAGYRVLEAAIRENRSVPLVMASVDLVRLDEANQLVLEESDLLGSDLAAGTFPAADRTEFIELVAVRRSLLADTLPQLSPTYRAIYDRDVSAADATALTQLESSVIHSPAGRRLPPAQLLPWESTVTSYSAGLATALSRSAGVIAARTQAQQRDTYLRLVLAGGLGLLAIIASLVFSALIGRGLVRQLAQLRDSALELANDRLPGVMRRLRDGQPVEISAEAPPVESSADEIDQVRQAFNIAARTAIEAAVEEANLRRGVSEVFRNLARRSQVLLHRQLKLLDGMERRATEPEELEDLFRIDQLTTRMRRHAEGLIILAGESPGRGWRKPVPLVDVLRGAVAEVEDYTRIRVEARTRAALAGTAVADVIHLVAELAENATVFSPSHTPVRIQGDVVGRGFAVEIEDRGIGLSPDRLAQLNHQLSVAPAFDLSGSDRMGLFIAGRLAQRHEITISLRPSPYGGTTAIVIIPLNLLVDPSAGDRADAPAGPRASGVAAAGRPDATASHRAAAGDGAEPAETVPPPAVPAQAALTETVPAQAVLTETVPAPGMPSRSVPGQAAPLRGAPWPAVASPAGHWADEERPPLNGRPISPRDRPAGAPAAVGAPAASAWSADNRESLITTADLTALGLPLRIRRPRLAPQLRQPPPMPDDPPGPVPAVATVSPEAAQTAMAALQPGRQRGRSAAREAAAADLGPAGADENLPGGTDG